MSDPEGRSRTTSPETKAAPAVDLKLEFVVSRFPTSNARSSSRRTRLAARRRFRPPRDYRVIQCTPPGSNTSVVFGKHVTPAAPAPPLDLPDRLRRRGGP